MSNARTSSKRGQKVKVKGTVDENVRTFLTHLQHKWIYLPQTQTQMTLYYQIPVISRSA